jgi:hypothetical protein
LGLFYAYWMAKFYGYKLTDNGYVRNRKKFDWSEALQNSARIKYDNAESKKLENGEASRVDSLKAFKLRDRSVQQLLVSTRKHLNKIKAEGRFGKQDFRYVAEEDIYICPAGERLATTSRTRKTGWSCTATGLSELPHQAQLHH